MENKKTFSYFAISALVGIVVIILFFFVKIHFFVSPELSVEKNVSFEKDAENLKKVCYFGICVMYKNMGGHSSYSVITPEALQEGLTYNDVTKSYKKNNELDKFVITQEDPGNRFSITRTAEKPKDLDFLSTEIVNNITYKKRISEKKDSGPAIFDCTYIIEHNNYYYEINSLWCNKKSEDFKLLLGSVTFE
jgi:hypothetical protein